jgi:hypothetical protein
LEGDGYALVAADADRVAGAALERVAGADVEKADGGGCEVAIGRSRHFESVADESPRHCGSLPCMTAAWFSGFCRM